MENEKCNIEKLEGAGNWLIWKFQMRQILDAGEFFEIADGTSEQPAEGAPNYTAALTAWKRKDAKTRRAISTACGREPLLQIMNCETAAEMWSTLKSTFEQASKSNILFLQQKYYGFAKEPDDGIATFISKLMEVVQQLRDQDESISESMVMTKILMSLPAEYNHFHSAWESTSADQQTMANLRSRLLAEELRLKSQGQVETVEALVARLNLSKKTNTQKGNASRNRNNKGGKSKPKGKCFECGESGHWKRDCPKSKKQSAKSSDGTSTDAFVCHASTNGGDESAWIMDSGASDHMCHRREWFQNFTEVSTHVTVGNGERIGVQGRGDISVLAFNGSEWVRRRILDVLYVPDIHLNLFSSGKAMDRGHQMRSDDKRCEMMRNGDVVAVGVRKGKLYQMIFKVDAQATDAACANVAIKKTSLRVWHERLGHQNAAHVRSILRSRGIDFVDEDLKCEACVYGKQHRGSFKSREEKASSCGEIIHADVCGPMEETSHGGSRYFLLLKDDFSHYRHVCLLKHKSEVADNIKKFVKATQKEDGHNIRIFRSDNGKEFVNDELNTFFTEMGIHQQLTVPYTPEQNGCAEREMRTIVESARTMMHSRRLSKKFWAEAVAMATYVLNRTGTSTVADKAPYELWCGRPAKIDQLHIFGSEVFVHVPKEKRQKLDAKSVKCMFVGYDSRSKAYRVWNPQTNKMQVACDVVFLMEESTAGVDVCDDDAAEQNHGSNVTCDAAKEESASEASEVGDNDEETPNQPIERGALCELDRRNVIAGRLRNRENITAARRLSYVALSENHRFAMLAVHEEPRSYEQAIESSDHRQWELAMDDEYDSLIKNQTWNLVKPPNDQKVIDNRWVFKLKQHPDGSIDRYKARLVVRGFTQEYGVDYQETFSPVVKFTSIRAILALAAARRMKLRQFDVKTAFLNGVLQEDVFMSQPTGYDDGSGRVCKLNKSLYGLKQASRCWNKRFTEFIGKFDFKTSESDPCVFVYNGKRGLMILAIYVDDGLIVAENEDAILPVIDHLRKEFEIKVFDLKCFLGLEIDRRSDGSIHVNQRAYAEKVLKRFGMMECNPVATPSDNAQNLGDFVMDGELDFPYREAVGSLMYLAVGTRPDISFAVGNVSRYMDKPAAAHVNAVKRILKYIKGTSDTGIQFDCGGDLEFIGYSDADYAGDVETRRSTSGYVFMFGGGVISWGSERQKSVALSTTESEYMAASHAIKELVWLGRLLAELSPIRMDAPIFYMDNQSAIRLVKNPEYHKRTKHIDVRYHFIREKFEDGMFDLKYVETNEQLADVMTKALPGAKHRHFCVAMGVMPKNV